MTANGKIRRTPTSVVIRHKSVGVHRHVLIGEKNKAANQPLVVMHCCLSHGGMTRMRK